MVPFYSGHFNTSVVVARSLRTTYDADGGVLATSSGNTTLKCSPNESGDNVRIQTPDGRIESRQRFNLAFPSDPLVQEGDTMAWNNNVGLVLGTSNNSGGKGVLWIVSVDVIN